MIWMRNEEAPVEGKGNESTNEGTEEQSFNNSEF